MTTVSIRDVGERFVRVRDLTNAGPVAVTEGDRTTAYVVSPEEFERMWACYRRAMPVSELSDEDMSAILDARVPDHLDWDHEDDLDRA